MYKTKIIPIILLLLFALVIAGCSGPVTRHSNDGISKHDCDKEIVQMSWYDQASVDTDWPY